MYDLNAVRLQEHGTFSQNGFIVVHLTDENIHLLDQQHGPIDCLFIHVMIPQKCSGLFLYPDDLFRLSGQIEKITAFS